MKTRNRAVAFGLLAAGFLAAAAPAEGGGNRITAIRFWSLGDLTRVSIQTETDAVFRADRAETPPRIFFDLEGVGRQPGKRGIETIAVGDGLLKRIRTAETQPGTTRVVLDLEVHAEYSVSQLAKPPRVVIELRMPGRAMPTPPVRSTSGQHTLAGEPAAAPAEKPEPALDLPLAKRTAAPQPAKPEPALAPLELPPTRRAAQPATARLEAPLDLPPALRARPVKNEPAAPPPARTETSRTSQQASVAELNGPHPQTAPELSRDREGAEPNRAGQQTAAAGRPQTVPKLRPDREGAEPAKPAAEPNRVPQQTAAAGRPQTVPELRPDREGAEPAKPAAEPNRAGQQTAAAARPQTAPELSRDREGAAPPKLAAEPNRAGQQTAAAGHPQTAPELSRDREGAAPNHTGQQTAPAELNRPRPQTTPELSRDREGAAPAKPAGGPALAAKSDSLGSRSLIRALGLKLERIVLDPGHGGHDTGTIGPGGMQEKELVLDIAQRLGKLIEQRLGSEVVYTRTDDTFIPLEERTVIANERKADLFLSIHANSSRTPSIAGTETFYLNFTTSADELEVAARENATSETSIHELQDLLQNIVKKEKAQESREFAGSIQKALYSGLSRGRGKNRGVKKAPFVVLIKATMPSVLAEVAFLSNPREESQLKRPDYRQRVAEALYRGVSQYANTLSHFRTAQENPPKPAVEQPGQAR